MSLDMIDLCIRLKVPESGNPEIDRLITESRRLDFVQAAMQAVVTNRAPLSESYPEMVEYTVSCADALIEKLKGGKS